MSDTPQLALSDLRPLWRQAKSFWYNGYGEPFGVIFRGYAREEIARRTIAELRERVAQLETKARLSRQAYMALDLELLDEDEDE